MVAAIPNYGRWVPCPVSFGVSAQQARLTLANALRGGGYDVRPASAWTLRKSTPWELAIREPWDIAVMVQLRDGPSGPQLRFLRTEGGWAWGLLVLWLVPGLVALLWDEHKRDQLKANVWQGLQGPAS